MSKENKKEVNVLLEILNDYLKIYLEERDKRVLEPMGRIALRLEELGYKVGADDNGYVLMA